MKTKNLKNVDAGQAIVTLKVKVQVAELLIVLTGMIIFKKFLVVVVVVVFVCME